MSDYVNQEERKLLIDKKMRRGISEAYAVKLVDKEIKEMERNHHAEKYLKLKGVKRK